jgi:hypothetical protein
MPGPVYGVDLPPLTAPIPSNLLPPACPSMFMVCPLTVVINRLSIMHHNTEDEEITDFKNLKKKVPEFIDILVAGFNMNN